MTPEIIADRYRVERAIGKGGGGTVWLCRDERLGRTVAIKQIVNPPGESSTETARAMREARHAAALNHPNVVAVYDVVEEHDQPWLIMEYVNGPSLSELIREEGRLEPQRVATLGAQLAGALAHAHDAGIIHRDIKPGNAMIAPGDRAKVMDFGIARAQHDEQLTQTGFVSGTVTYFSPELARGEEPSYPSDVWALGATLYAAVEGKPPYENLGNPLSTLRRIDASPYARPQHAGPLEPVLAGMMHRAPQRRWTMHEAQEALQAVSAGRAVPEHLLATAGITAASAGAAPGAGGADATQQVPTGGWQDDYTSSQQATMGAAGAGAAGYGGGYGDAGYGGGGGYGGGYDDRYDDEDDEERRGGWVVPVVIGLVLLLLAGVLFVVLTQGSSDDEPTSPSTSQSGTTAPETTAPQTTAPETTAPETTTQPPTTEPPTTEPETTQPPTTEPETTQPPTTEPETTEPETTEPETTQPETTDPSDDEATLQEMSQTVRDYYQKLPDDTDGSWAMLSDRVQGNQSRDGYDRFWGTIDDVKVVGSPETTDNPNEIVAVVRYTKSSGDELDELTRFTLVKDDAGNLRLDSTEVLERTSL